MQNEPDNSAREWGQDEPDRAPHVIAIVAVCVAITLAMLAGFLGHAWWFSAVCQ